MKHLFLTAFVISLCSVAVTYNVMAQTTSSNTPAPIFINPYKAAVPTYASQVPNLVRSNGQSQYSQAQRQYTKPNTSSGPVYDKPFSPFAPGYGRIRGEKEFYDTVDEKYYQQYEYMTVLAKRGDKAKLQQVVSDVQTNGVFDPAKYNAALVAAQNGGTSGTTNADPLNPSSPVTPTGQKRVFVNKNATSPTPQKIHQGYDDDTAQPQAQSPTPRKNQPIFLK